MWVSGQISIPPNKRLHMLSVNQTDLVPHGLKYSSPIVTGITGHHYHSAGLSASHATGQLASANGIVFNDGAVLINHTNLKDILCQVDGNESSINPDERPPNELS